LIDELHFIVFIAYAHNFRRYFIGLKMLSF
jgi:hypothetical protein